MKNNIRTWMEKDSLLRERCVKTRKIHAKKIKTRQTHRDPWVINALADSFVLFSFTQTTNGWGRVRQSFVITEQRVFLFHHSNPWYPDAPSTHLLKLLMLILFYEFLFLHTTLCNERKWNFLYSFWCPKKCENSSKLDWIWNQINQKMFEKNIVASFESFFWLFAASLKDYWNKTFWANRRCALRKKPSAWERRHFCSDCILADAWEDHFSAKHFQGLG